MMILASYWVGTYFLLGFGSIELELCLTYAFLLCIHFINILSKLYNEIYIYSVTSIYGHTLEVFIKESHEYILQLLPLDFCQPTSNLT